MKKGKANKRSLEGGALRDIESVMTQENRTDSYDELQDDQLEGRLELNPYSRLHQEQTTTKTADMVGLTGQQKEPVKNELVTLVKAPGNTRKAKITDYLTATRRQKAAELLSATAGGPSMVRDQQKIDKSILGETVDTVGKF
mgnify:CR=1 FL=1